MWKMMGCVLVLSGAAGIGWSMCESMENRIRQLDILRFLFSVVGSEVEYHNAVLPEALRRAQQQLGDILGERLMKVYERNVLGERLEDIWDEEMEIWLKVSALSEKEKQLVRRFPECIGFTDGKMQLKQIRYMETEILKAWKNAREETDSKKKMVMSLCVSAGFFAVILLV